MYWTAIVSPSNNSRRSGWSVSQLEGRLGITRHQNFLDGKGALARRAFASSGVSKQNRMVERHPYNSGRGFYWISFEFKPRKSRGDLVRFPLGPVFQGNP